MAIWTTARDQARHNEQGTLASRTSDDDPNVTYARLALRKHLRDGYTVAAKRCAWCGEKHNLRTGTVEGQAILFCPEHNHAYHYARGDSETLAEVNKVHLDDGRGNSRCGIGVGVTRDRRAVTCARCQIYL